MAACKLRFYRTFCAFCNKAGHSQDECPLKRRQENKNRWEEHKVQAAELREALRKNDQLARVPYRGAKPNARKSCEGSDDGTANMTSGTASLSTSACSTKDVRKLTNTEKDVKKHEKALREILNIERRLARGEKVDILQREKALRRLEIEESLRKLRAGGPPST